MTEKIDLKNIEKKAWASYFQDGLFDIFLGLIALNFGIAPLIEDITGITYLISYGIMLIVAFILFYTGKKYITATRIGRAKFSGERKIKNRKTTLVLAISVIFGCIVLLITATNISPITSNIHFGAVVFGINAVIVFSVMAYFLDFNRLYVYGWLFAGSIVLVEVSRGYVGTAYDNVIGFGTSGVIMICIGLAYLIRFLQRYPLTSEVLSHG
jgi:uncharacterized membrane protein